ncbi:MAG: hypothetical protein CXT71_00235 [Methanobacteriota archaeon]|nr:MAG: hypothetical protein CXT71_00235 [Euryarchaeota archaeon]HIL65967.1 hypothetical protein [Candidatus Poseidoniales archaeon]
MAEETILESTERTSGREALRKNVQAAIALAGAVRSTLGPMGLDKLLIDDEGRTLVTNDGVTVLENARVEHPVARMIISASSTQDRVARDGTTSTVVICAEMLRNAWQLVRQGVHPATIARGFSQAEEFALSALSELKIEADLDQIKSAVETSLAGKMDQASQIHLSGLALEAANNILKDGRADPTRVKVIQQGGSKIGNTELTSGLAIAKTKIHPEMHENGGPGTILLIDGGIERRKPLAETKISVESVGMLDAFRAAESKALAKQIDNLISIGCDLVVCREGVDDEAKQALANAGILAYRRVESKDLDLLANSCGATTVHDATRASKADLGVFIQTREELRGGVNHWILDAEDGGATLIARASTKEVLGEVERCFADALGVACQLVEQPWLLPGAGATQVALARRLRRHAESISSREQMAIEAWADALESIPRALARNAGLDGINMLLKLTAAQAQDGPNIGLDLESGGVSDVIERGILEPFNITRQALTGATEAAVSILRIDDVLWAQVEAHIPDEIQQQLAQGN